MTERDDLCSLLDCENCSLVDVHAVQPPVFGDGPFEAPLVFVGEAPGRTEAQQGKPFVGRAGQLLNATLTECGMRREDVYITNVVACRPTVNGVDAPPDERARRACYDRLIAEISWRDPKIIVALGGTAAQVMCNTDQPISKIAGAPYYNGTLDCFVIPTYHPAAVLHGNLGMFTDILDVVKRACMIVRGELPAPRQEFEVPYELCETAGQVERTLNELLHYAGVARRLHPNRGPLQLALDTESTGLTWVQHPLLSVQISDGEHQWVLVGDALLQEVNRLKFKALLRHPDVEWILHNMKYDFKVLYHQFGQVPKVAVDTMCLALGTTERQQAVGLKYLAHAYMNAPLYEEKLVPHMGKEPEPFKNIPLDVLAEYGAADAYNTWHLRPILDTMVEREGATKLCYELLMPAQRAFAQIEYHGILIDTDYVEELEREWLPLLAEDEKWMQDYAKVRGFTPTQVLKGAKPGDPLNPGSPQQLMHLCFDILNLKKPQGRRTTDAEFLSANKNHEFVEKLSHYRKAKHMMSTYVYGFVDDIHPRDGRVHPDMLLFGTVTGRLSIRNPPMQTIPREDTIETGFGSCKRLFIAGPGYTFVHADYSQLELRIAWHLTGTEGIGQAMRSGDFHRAAAAKIFGKRPEEVTSHEREVSKFVTYGIAYGRGPWSLEEEHGWAPGQGQAYINEFWSGFPLYHEWYRRAQWQAVHTGFVTTPFGRKRRWNLITDLTRGTIERQAVNAPIQATASDLCLSSLIRLTDELRERDLGWPLSTVHDSIEFEVRSERLEEAIELITSIMTTPPFETTAEFTVDIGYGRSWGDLTKWSR